jgi:hypothetical protein
VRYLFIDLHIRNQTSGTQFLPNLIASALFPAIIVAIGGLNYSEATEACGHQCFALSATRNHGLVLLDRPNGLDKRRATYQIVPVRCFRLLYLSCLIALPRNTISYPIPNFNDQEELFFADTGED